MNDFFGMDIYKALPVPYRYIYDENFEKFLNNSKVFKASYIYYICTVDKVIIKEKSTVLHPNFELETTIIFKQNEITLKIPVFKVSSYLQNLFKTEGEYENALLLNNNKLWTLELLNQLEQQITLRLHFNVENLYNDFVISIEDIECFVNLEIKNYPKIEYIGRSFGVLDRIRKHEKLIEISTKLKSGRDIRVYFMNFKSLLSGGKNFFASSTYKLLFDKVERKSKTATDRIGLIERFLIHYFKPVFNSDHRDCNISNDKLIRSALIKNKISAVMINHGMVGDQFQFWTDDRNEFWDFISFDFKNPKVGYQNKLVSIGK